MKSRTKVDESFIPSFGDIFHSTYFASDCVVLVYENPKDWTFVVKNNPTRILKAQSPPHQFVWYIERPCGCGMGGRENY